MNWTLKNVICDLSLIGVISNTIKRKRLEFLFSCLNFTRKDAQKYLPGVCELWKEKALSESFFV